MTSYAFIIDVLKLKTEAAQRGLWSTFRALDAAANAYGWEAAKQLNEQFKPLVRYKGSDACRWREPRTHLNVKNIKAIPSEELNQIVATLLGVPELNFCGSLDCSVLLESMVPEGGWGLWDDGVEDLSYGTFLRNVRSRDGDTHGLKRYCSTARQRTEAFLLFVLSSRMILLPEAGKLPE